MDSISVRCADANSPASRCRSGLCPRGSHAQVANGSMANTRFCRRSSVRRPSVAFGLLRGDPARHVPGDAMDQVAACVGQALRLDS
jgi:hypothetical protein